LLRELRLGKPTRNHVSANSAREGREGCPS
jgi:hypothetical protein